MPCHRLATELKYPIKNWSWFINFPTFKKSWEAKAFLVSVISGIVILTNGDLKDSYHT